MTSHLYAIADAGGNIYPGTFHTDAGQSMMARMGNPNYCPFIKDVKGNMRPCEDWWRARTLPGDHVVYCRIETNETVVVTQEPTL